MEQIKGLEWLYDLYSQDPSRLSEEWREYFAHGLSHDTQSFLPRVSDKKKSISLQEKKMLYFSILFDHTLTNIIILNYP